MGRQRALELELQTQKDRILHLESYQQTQISAFEERYDKWEKEKSSLEIQRKKAEDGMAEKHAREMVEADKDLRHETERANSLAKRLDRANAEVNLVKKELAVCNDKLQEWESYTAKLKKVDFESLLVTLSLYGHTFQYADYFIV